MEMDALRLSRPSWNQWDSKRSPNDSTDEEKDDSSNDVLDSAEYTCIDLNNFQNGQRTKSYNDISYKKMLPTCNEKSSSSVIRGPTPQRHKDEWNISSSSTTPSESFENLSNLIGPNNLTKSLVDMTASCSNVSMRTSSFFRKCNSTASLPSAFLDQMIDQLQAKGIQIPTKDRKIMELMISRHESYIEELERSNSSHRIWEKEKLSTYEKQKREEMRHRQYVLDKFQAERKLRDIKKLEVLEKEEADIHEKEKFLKFKTEKWKDRWDMQETARKEAFLKIKMRENHRKQTQEKYLREKMAVDELCKKMLAMDSECRLVKSLQDRQCREVELLIKLKKENKQAEKKHASRMKEVENHFKEKLELLKEDLEVKECITNRNRKTLLHELELKCKHEAEERRRHAQQVNEALEKLEKCNQRWYRDVMSYQQQQLKLVEDRAKRILNKRVFSVRKDRMQRLQRHDRQMQEIQDQEKMDLLLATRKLNQKNEKCEKLSRKKVSTIQQSRQIAQASSDLRERLKWIFEQDILGRRFPLLDPHSHMNTAPPTDLSIFN